MGIFDTVQFTIKEKAERGLPLPEILWSDNIVNLWSEDSREQELIASVMLHAIENKKSSLMNFFLRKGLPVLFRKFTEKTKRFGSDGIVTKIICLITIHKQK